MAGTIWVKAAVGAGFGLIRRRPVAMLAWGAVMTLAFGLVAAAYAWWITNMFAAGAGQRLGAHPSPGQTTALFGVMIAGEGAFFLAIIGMTFLQTIVTTAVWRAVVHPEQGRWAYLRVGMAELFVFLIKVAVQFLANFAMLPLMPFLIIVGVLLGFHQYAAAAVVGVLMIFAIVSAVVYVELRFALLGPMIVDDGEFHFLEAWRLSRGKVGRLLLTGLSLVGVLFAAEAIILVLTFTTGAAVLSLAAGGLDNLQAFFQKGPQWVAGRLWPLVAVWAIAAIPVAGSLSAIMAAPWARAYRDAASQA